jgi:polyhydroxybutyrate depolymerase
MKIFILTPIFNSFVAVFLFSLISFSSLNLFAQGLGEYVSIQIEVEGVTRSFTFYQPPAYDASEPAPLVLSFHGYTLSANNQVQISKMYEVADTANFLIAYPAGLVVNDLVFGGSNTGWHIPGGYSASHDDVLFVESILDTLIANPDINIDTDRIYATGFSNGSEMVMYLACELADRIAAIGGVSGPLSNALINSGCEPERKIAVLHMLGTNDNFYPKQGNATYPSFEELAEYWATINACNLTPTITEFDDIATDDNSTVTFYTYSECASNTEVLSYLIDGGNHSWPGGGYTSSSTNFDINASVEIWNFFLRNPMEIISSIKELRDIPQIKVYPNPVLGDQLFFEIELPESTSLQIQIINSIGQQIGNLMNSDLTAGRHKIVLTLDEANIQDGLYFMHVISEKGSARSMPLVLQSN